MSALMQSKVRDEISTRSMLEKFDLLSVNQLAAQIKITEVWKSVYVEGYAIELDPYNNLNSTSTKNNILNSTSTKFNHLK